MTPKEKAEELFKKYEDCYPKNYDKTGRNFFNDRIKISALIAVDELINEYESNICNRGYDYDWEMWDMERDYWIEVKQEIEQTKN